MRSTSLASMAVVLTGMLAVCTTESASAAQYTKDCKGTHQALQGGECVNLSYTNPNRVRPDYYSSYYKRQKAKKSSPKTEQ
jgi:hypothetical protein